ncbi:GTP-binding protein [Niveomyces insectorum RCEF 264]|uniref:GTP-binding protein n=1 Tax=Niveomyces insectorum RCEF 264 TaxID=1081102 RepID=A0A167NBF3_9HYPO|nr:GTP-binding protein [Niveomyces insectorum RCEF 264]
MNACKHKRNRQALQRQIDTRQRDLQRIDRRAENVYTGLRSLLELKQMQSNALEAKFARDQAVTASKQDQAILVFTVVTIVFLPMSFMATLFTINIDVWSNPLPPPYVAKYTFSIGLGISIPLFIIALTVTDTIAATSRCLVATKNLLVAGWAPSFQQRERANLPGRTTAGRTPAAAAADSPPLKSTLSNLAIRSRRPSPYPKEPIDDGRPLKWHGRRMSQGLFGSDHSIAWTRGKSRNRDPEHGRSVY